MVLGIAGLAACGASSESTAGFAREDGANGAASSSGGAPGAPAEPPPEKEVESEYEAPVATGNFVWVANPKSGRVAFVDAATLQVRTVEAGNGPTFLASVPAQVLDTTLVINVLSQDATLLRASKDKIETKTFKVARLANSLAFSKDGRFAIAWANAAKNAAAPKTEGFQDITVIDLQAGTSTILAVGYRPVSVGFVDNVPRAYAVTQDGVAIVDLAAAPVVTKNVLLSDNPTEDPGTRDVSVTPNGQLALIRRDNQKTITVLSLDTGERKNVELPDNVTDLDLSDKGDRAVAVIRNTHQIAVLPVPGIFGAPATFSTVTIGTEKVGSVSLSAGGNRGLLYTNAEAVERLTVLELDKDPPPFRTVRLYSPVRAVFSAPNAQHSLVVHEPSVTNGPAAFSLVPIGSALPPKIVATQGPVAAGAVAMTNDRAIVAERDDKKKVYAAYIATLPQLMVDRYPLASPPNAAGVVPGAKRAFIAQEHPEGRLTFVDLDTGVARTLTGFELSSRVVDGSRP